MPVSIPKRSRSRRTVSCLLLSMVVPFLTSCSESATSRAETRAEEASQARSEPTKEPTADVTAVETRQDDGIVQFLVTIASDDTGCEQYADWWEVVSEEGDLLYRRILTHSHVDEQPFTRRGGPVPVAPDRTVVVRAHMHPSGYVGDAMRGSIERGWESVRLGAFAPELAKRPPLPDGCRF